MPEREDVLPLVLEILRANMPHAHRGVQGADEEVAEKREQLHAIASSANWRS